MFRVGDDSMEEEINLYSPGNRHQNGGTATDSPMIGEPTAEVDELTIFGGFDQDDPDFQQQQQQQSGDGDAPRPRSRMASQMSRNSSSSSLRKAASTTSIGRLNLPKNRSQEYLRERRSSSSLSQVTSNRSSQADLAGIMITCDTVHENHDNMGDGLHDPVLSFLRPPLETTLCFTCGVNWDQEQFSFDCRECDGYTMTRPCLKCKGTCGQLWFRDVISSHSMKRAMWQGVCAAGGNASDEEDEEPSGIILTIPPPSRDPFMQSVLNKLSNL